MVTREYHANGEIKKETYPTGRTFEYDEKGKCIKHISSRNGGDGYKYFYDENENHIKSVCIQGKDFGMVWEYDGYGFNTKTYKNHFLLSDNLFRI